MGSNHSMKQSWTCHISLAKQCDRLWWSLSFFRLVRVRANQKFDLHYIHPLLKCWAWISLRFWLILVCMYVAETLKYLCSNHLRTERLFIECFNDQGCFSDPSITVHASCVTPMVLAYGVCSYVVTGVLRSTVIYCDCIQYQMALQWFLHQSGRW
jgi:hypothetical protein